jgi:hypothetical protein
MSKRLVIDSQLAVRYPAGIFDENWSWPIKQSEYDQPIAEFFEWSDELHKELADLPQLLSAFLLIKTDLLKDLSYYAAAWLDVAAAERAGYEVLFGPNQYIHQSIVSGEYGGKFPTEILRRPISSGIRGKVRKQLSQLKRTRANKRALGSLAANVFLFQPNHLSNEILVDDAPRLRLLAGDVDRWRGILSGVPERVDELANYISRRFCEILSNHGYSPPTKFDNHARAISSHYLQIGWHDAGATSLLPLPRQKSTLVTGTASGYPARLMAYQSLSEGHRVIRTTHGGDPPMFDDVLLPSIDFHFATKYVVNGAAGAESLTGSITRRSESVLEHYTRSVIGAGSELHSRIREVASESPTGKVKTVSVITASLTGMIRVVPRMKLHDVVYLEWHRRLLASIKQMGYEVISKRHPKASLAGQRIFGGIPDEELISTPMQAIEQRTDAYVIDFGASAFMEALCTLKPVILIDMGIRMLKPEARAAISKSAVIITSRFDDRNRVVIDEEELKMGLEKLVDIPARDRLIQDYLLRTSADIGSIFE